MQSQPLLSIWKIAFRGLSVQAQSELLSRMPVQEGSLLSDELRQETIRAVKSFDTRLEIEFTNAPGPDEYLKLPQKLRDRLKPAPHDNAVNIAIYDPATLPLRVKIEASVQESMLVEQVMPVDPRQTGDDVLETGMVRLAVVVGKDGTVIDVKPPAGPQLLLDSAMYAVRRWRYRPMLLNGRPVEVQTTVDVTFLPNR